MHHASRERTQNNLKIKIEGNQEKCFAGQTRSHKFRVFVVWSPTKTHKRSIGAYGHQNITITPFLRFSMDNFKGFVPVIMSKLTYFPIVDVFQ